MKVYLDASAIIYAIESTLPLRQKVLDRLAQAQKINGSTIVTSRLSRLECRVKPLRDGNSQLLSTYEAFFSQAAFRIIDISAAIIERATDIRVRYSLKTPDAIHVATAIEQSADLLLTGDRDMARCGEVRVEII